MNYIYNFQKGIDSINFGDSEETIISILGAPDKTVRESYLMCNTIEMSYEYIGIDFSYTNYYKPDFVTDSYTDEIEVIDTHIGLYKKFVFEGTNWFDLDKKQIIKTIREIFAHYGLKYNVDYEKTELIEFTSEQYFYDELGISLFFRDNKLSSVFISKPEEELILPQPKKKPKVKQYQLEPLETDLLMVSEPKTEYKRSKKI